MALTEGSGVTRACFCLWCFAHRDFDLRIPYHRQNDGRLVLDPAVQAMLNQRLEIVAPAEEVFSSIVSHSHGRFGPLLDECVAE